MERRLREGGGKERGSGKGVCQSSPGIKYCVRFETAGMHISAVHIIHAEPALVFLALEYTKYLTLSTSVALAISWQGATESRALRNGSTIVPCRVVKDLTIRAQAHLERYWCVFPNAYTAGIRSASRDLPARNSSFSSPPPAEPPRYCYSRPGQWQQ